MATGVDQQEYVDSFDEFFREYYRDEIGELARNYPSEQKSLFVDWDDLYRYDRELAEQYCNQPEQLQRCAEEALRVYDLPIDVSLGQAHVRIRNIPETTDIRELRAEHVNDLVAVTGIVRKATDVRPKCEEAAFRCVRCETLTRVPQDGASFQEPHECRSCERQGPFQLSEDQSTFVDAQRLRIQESPEGLRGGETPQAIDVNIEDDVTGEVTPGDHVTATGILRLTQDGGEDSSPIFDVHMEGISVEVDEEEFEDMDITESDKETILELADRDDVYEQMIGAIAPSIHGYDQQKLAMTLQLFSGVTKHLPDGSRIRGDLHMLFIGDPGTGKCVSGDTKITLGDGTRVPIREFVESNLDDPTPVDDGVYDTVDVSVPSMAPDGTMTRRRATKVWKREAPERLYRVRTSSGRVIDITPSHPLFVQTGGVPEARRADCLETGDSVAVPEELPADLRDPESVRDDSRAARQIVPDGGVTGRPGVAWDRIDSIEPVEPDDDWVYDLEVEGTHTYVSNGLVSHNSQLLQYVRNIAPRSVYTSGKGSSSAGLTAAAVRDDFGDGQQWSLEAGALVLADQGIAAVDELDKMRCVTGDTLVHLGDGRVDRIRDLALEAAENGTVEELENGRTIRDVDLTAWAMTDDGRLVQRPVTAVHEYEAPSELTEVRLESGETLTSTPDHPYFVFEGGKRVERPAADVAAGDWVYVPDEEPAAATDGGTASMPSRRRPDVGGDVTVRRVEAVEPAPDGRSDDGRECVYDLTVEGTHNFVANGMVVHNSEDRSAMHEALEQQSYHPDTEVLLTDGRRVRIGEFVDQTMSNRSDDVVDGVDCQILPVDGVRVHTIDLSSNEVSKAPVDRVSRHEAPDEFVRVTFSNGRTVTVTPEHPMFVGNGSETIPATEIQEGDFVPAPRFLPNAPGGVALQGNEERSREKTITLPEAVTPDLAEFLGLFAAEGHSYAGSSHQIGFSNQDERLLQYTEQLAESIFGFESNETTNAEGTVTKRWISTRLYRWFQSNVPELVATARDKRIPAAVLGSSREIIRRFLVGAFAGDGSVESEAMAFSTASPGLAEDYADALSKLGIASRIHHDDTEDAYKTYIMGDSTREVVDAIVKEVDDRYESAQAFADRSEATPRHHDVLPTSVAREIRSLRNLLGLRLTGKFKPHLDERYGVQVATVEDELSELRSRIETVERALRDADELADVRAAIGWSGSQLADRLDGETTSAVHYAEDGGYDRERREALTSSATAAVHAALDEARGRIADLESMCELRYYRVRDVERVPNDGDDACEWVYDVTVEPTHTFVSSGVLLHNSISISKAGINATLKSRCSLLGAANPIHGRFDQYEPMGEQIDLEPALISRFDLIFTVTDEPDPEDDAELAEHILEANYAGQLNTQREQMPSPDVTVEEVQDAQSTVEPTIDPDLLRKYVAYAQQNCYPRMTDDARERIRDFYVELRSKGADDDAPVPVTARKLEALVRLSEASARVRLADEVAVEDAERVIEIVRSCLQDIGVDPETGEFDADIIETGTSKTQRDRIKNLKALIDDMAEEFEEGVPVDQLLERADEVGIGADKAERELEKLKQKGEVYEPRTDHVRTT